MASPGDGISARIAWIGAAALLGQIVALCLLPDGLIPASAVFAVLSAIMCAAAVIVAPRRFSLWLDLPLLAYAGAVALSAYLAPPGGAPDAWRDALWFSVLAMATWRVALNLRMTAAAVACVVASLAVLLASTLGPRSNPDLVGRFYYYPAVGHWGAYPEIGMLAGIGGGAALAIALAARIWRLRISGLVLTALFGLVPVLVLSRSGILAFAGLGAWLVLAAAIKWRERWVLLAVVVACAGGVYAARHLDTGQLEREYQPNENVYQPNQASAAIGARAMHWDAARGMIRDHPWNGVGPGRFTLEFPNYETRTGPQLHAHNMLLNVAAETGIVALVPFVLIWARVLLGTLFAPRRGRVAVIAFAAHGMVMAFFIRNMTDHFLTSVHSSLRTSLFVAVLLGLAEASIRGSRAASAPPSSEPV